MKSHKITKTIVKGFLKIVCGAHATGLENVPKDGGYIVCSNHKSNFDPVILGGLLPDFMCYLAKSELFKFKPLAMLIKELGAVPINRKTADAGAIKTAEKLLKQGDVLVIFPQGHRRKTFDIHTGKQGAALIAKRIGVPVLPVGIKGFSINIGKPIQLETDDTKEATLQIMKAIGVLI